MGRCTRMILMALAIFLGMASKASATTYYIAANGSDSNNGTSEASAWQHAPGMPACSNTCAGVTPQPGDIFIFRGGDAWHRSNTSATDNSANVYTGGEWDWTWSGNSLGTNCNYPTTVSTCITLEGDGVWYNSSVCGASYCRPQLEMDNPLWVNAGANQDSTRPGFVTACTYNDQPSSSNGTSFGVVTGAGVLLQNFNIWGFCISGFNSGTSCTGSEIKMSISGNAYNFFVNNWLHGWSESYNPQSDGGAAFDECSMLGGTSSPPAGGTHNVVAFSSFDGSDAGPCQAPWEGSISVSGSSITVTSGPSLPTGYTGFIVMNFGNAAGDFGNDHYKIIITSATTATAQGVTPPQGANNANINFCTGGPIRYGDCWNYSHNEFRYLAIGGLCYSDTVIANNTFENIYESFDPASHSQVYENPSPPNDCTPSNVYIYNNLIRNTNTGETFELSTCGGYSTYFFNNVFWNIGNGGNGIILDGNETPTPTVYITNNTFDQGVAADGTPFKIRFVPSYGAVLNIILENNHLIGGYTCPVSASSNLFSGTTGGTITDNGNEVCQSESAANAQGYTSSNNYQPTSASGATVQAGNNLSSSCSTYSPDSALCSGTSGGYTNTAGSGTIPTPYITPVSRGTTFDAGAYQYSESTSSLPNPPTGLVVSVQ
jgi:hypothetical protein